MTEGPLNDTKISPMKPRITQEEIDSAAANLARSQTGQGALFDLLGFLERDGLVLDGTNQCAVRTLLNAAWQGRGQFIRDTIREHLRAAGRRVK